MSAQSDYHPSLPGTIGLIFTILMAILSIIFGGISASESGHNMTVWSIVALLWFAVGAILVLAKVRIDTIYFYLLGITFLFGQRGLL